MLLRDSLMAVGLLSLMTLTGCAGKKEIFYWGEYEGLVYDMYINPGSADTTTQISKLTTDIQKAEAKDMPIAPGINAHLGYMYVLEGDIGQAKAAFLTEKTLFPESASFIDGMMSRIDGVKK
ncbi:DUF4810 domain-containing protein [Thalassolituus oleivorans]|uniref:DUF4810 domain-containing protein n=1 Tax=Thalassolituus oleivorans TaxID=187493 RepID=UPI000BC4AC1C|nr:DUF4810 domain-containing protein [Thalassolituus oleivorans]PCI49503.1 MAG: DUF4810 domain-containing protein [Oceanospirillales bacterium]